MRPHYVFTLITLALAASAAMAADGLVEIKSPYPAHETMDRMEQVAKQHGMKIFARVDHAAGAASVGKRLRPTELLIFGNPQGGTSLMECAQTAGIDLPMKALAWEDANGQAWLGYDDPVFIARRHGAEACPVVENLGRALAGLAKATVDR